MRSALLLFAILIAISLQGFGQAAPPSENVLKAGANEVLLDLVVHDKKNKPVRDLRPGEIRVFEDGVPQKITSFRLRDASQQQDIQKASAASEAKAATQPDALRQINLVSVVFDRLSTGGRHLARQTLTDFISKPLPANTYIAVFVLEDRLDLVQPYTNDLQLVQSAADRAMKGSYSQYNHDSEQMLAPMEELNTRVWISKSTNQPRRRMDELLIEILKAQVHIGRYQQGSRQLQALESLVRGQGILPGRKSVLYFSEGLTIPQPLQNVFANLVGVANRNNVTFYAFDVRGLRANNTVDPESQRRELQDMASGEWDPASVSSNFDNTQMGLDQLAKGTGGFLAANSNDMRAPLKRVLDDIETHYELSYTPASTNYDGHFRKISVQVSRPGASVQTRSGYFAVPMIAGERASPYELALLKVLEDKPLPQAFEFHAAVIPFQKTVNQRSCVVVFEVPIAGLHFRQDANATLFKLHASVLALFKDASGQVAGKVSRNMLYEVPAKQFDGFRQGTLTDIEQIDLPPGRYTIASAVLDNEALSASARRIATIVPGSDDGPSLSSISVLRRVDAINGEVNPFDPLQFSGGRAIPSLSQSIIEGPEAKAIVFLVIYPQKSDEPPKLAIDLMQNGKVLVHSEPVLDSPDQHGAIPYLATIPASNLKPGNYQVLVKLTQGNKTAQQQTWFDIDPAPAR